MTRIIAGSAGSITLAVPGSGTRPTSDRVREAIFSALDSRDSIHGTSVVDLYAGSGALGLEMASRGAGHVVLVEKNVRAAGICRRNTATVQRSIPAGVRIDVALAPVQQFLTQTFHRFDVAFLDPPYDLDEKTLEADLRLLVPRLTGRATVMVERGSRSPEPVWPAGLELDRRKDYGDTTLWWAQRSSDRTHDVTSASGLASSR